jgi:outer membrane immunogenic protein
MRRFQVFIGFLLSAAILVSAQTFPKVEASAGYSYMRFNASTAASANCNGGYGSIGGNFNNWFGIVGNVDACQTNGTAGASSTATNFLFGPKFACRKCCRITPFAQLLVGGIHANAGFPGVTASTNAFAFAAGGGVDVRPWRSCRLALRVAEVNYVLTHFKGSIQNNFQFKTGIVLQWW